MKPISDEQIRALWEHHKPEAMRMFAAKHPDYAVVVPEPLPTLLSSQAEEHLEVRTIVFRKEQRTAISANAIHHRVRCGDVIVDTWVEQRGSQE